MTSNSRRKRILKVISFASLITFSFSQGIQAQQNPPQNATNRLGSLQQAAIQPKLLAKLSGESILAKKLSMQTVLSRKPITAAFLQNEVVLESGQTEKLGNVVGAVFTEQADFFQNAQRAAAGVLTAPPEADDEVLEFDDSYALVRSTSVVVANPQAFAQTSQAFRDFVGTAPSGIVSKADLKPEGTAGLAEFMANELPNLPPDNPLRQAAEQGGEEAVLRAISEGKGTFEIVDTIIVPKRAFLVANGQLQQPAFQNGVLIYNRPQPFQTQSLELSNLMQIDFSALQAADAGRQERARAEERPAAPAARTVIQPEIEKTGTAVYEIEFLAGFTRASSWEWERRWNFPSGFFRLTLFGSYGIGMRIPIKVDGELSPADITVKDIQDRSIPIQNKIRVNAINADANFYRRAGLAGNKIFNGDEAVLEVRFGWGCKLRAFWIDLYHNPNSWDLNFNFNEDFTPPFGADRTGFRIAIPPSLTSTELNLGVLKGYAQAGFSVGGQGTIELDHEFFLGSRKLDTQTLRFRDTSYKTLDVLLPALDVSGLFGKNEFGVEFKNPKYEINMTITPEIKVALTAGYQSLSRTFSTGWIPLNSMKVRLGTIPFERHAGSRSAFKFDKGQKKFVKLQESRQAEIVPFISHHSNKFVRPAVTEQSLLEASGSRMSEWGQFQIYELGNNEIAIRSVRSAKYVTVGPPPRFYLYALSDEIGDAQKFHKETIFPGIYALRAKRSGKYVRAGMGDRSSLGATSDSISDWEKFLFAEPVIATTAEQPWVKTATFAPPTISANTATSHPATATVNAQNVSSAAVNTASNKKPTSSGIVLTGYKKK